MKPKTDVYVEWEKLIMADDRSPEAQEPGWAVLYARCRQEGV
jgi:hypothetical protein